MSIHEDYADCAKSLEALAKEHVALEESITAMNTVESSLGFQQADEPFAATDHQKHLMDVYRGISQQGNSPAVAADKEIASLEAQGDNAPDVKAEVSRAVLGMLKGAMENSVDTAEKSFNQAKVLFWHYAKLATSAKKRAQELLEVAKSQKEVPLYLEDFQTRAYSRFFQIAGQSVSTIPELSDALVHHETALEHCATYGLAQYRQTSQEIISAIGLMASKVRPEYVEEFKDTYAVITQQWADVWDKAQLMPLTKATHWSPAAFAGAMNGLRPDCYYHAVSPLLDNRYLVAYSPKSPAPSDVGSLAQHLGLYGADVVQGKASVAHPVTSVSVASTAEIITMLQTVVRLCDLVIMYQSHAGDAGKKASQFKEAGKLLKKQIEDIRGREQVQYLSLYLKMIYGLAQGITQPHVNMCWANLRAILMCLAVAENFLVPEGDRNVIRKGLHGEAEQIALSPAIEPAKKAQGFFDRVMAFFHRQR